MDRRKIQRLRGKTLMDRTVSIKPVTKHNWEDIIQISIYPKQQHYVLPVAVSLSKAYVKPEGLRIFPYSIYADDVIVGFFTIKCDPYSSQNYWVEGFMVDKEFQNTGYGTQALKEILVLVNKKFKNCKALKVKVEPSNKAAKRVCEKCGMKNTGIYSKGEEIFMVAIPEGALSRQEVA